MEFSDDRGSNWLKCDLHIHSPESFFHGYGDRADQKTWDSFFSDLENLPPDFRVIGINDYLTLAGYERVQRYREAGRLANLACILPVIEFRINRFAGESRLQRVNYHVIFSDDLLPATIRSQFLHAIATSYTLESGHPDPDWSAVLTDDSLEELGRRLKAKAPHNLSLQNETDWKVGFSNFNVDYKNLKDILNRPQFKGRLITAIGKGEWASFRWDAGGAADKRSIINEADMVFISAESPDHYERARAQLQEQQVNDTLLDCSDAHYYSTDTAQKDRIGNCHTWLKIEPTFSGLKQVLFEPQGRISIDETHPDRKAPYQVISHVCFTNGGKSFTSEPIRLSSGLNSVIGGKSTGKSLLAGLIVKASDPYEYGRRVERDKREQLDWITAAQQGVGFEVHWKDGIVTTLDGGTDQRKVTYFPQHYLHSRINDTGAGYKELNKLVRNILSQTAVYREAFTKYEENMQQLDQRVAASASAFEAKLRELRGLTHTLKEQGRSDDIRANIERLTEELAALRSQYDLTDSELQAHHMLLGTAKGLQEQDGIHKADIEILSGLDRASLEASVSLSRLFGERYADLSGPVRETLDERLEDASDAYLTRLLALVRDVRKEEEDRRQAVADEIDRISAEHAPILAKIQHSAPLREKSDAIERETSKLATVEKLETQLGRLEADAHPFADGDDKLGLIITSRCKSAYIREMLRDQIRYQSNTSVRSFINDETFGDTELETYSAHLKEILQQARTETLELKGSHTLAGLLQGLLSSTLYLNYDLQFGRESFNIMSPGKRALALLRVLVELDQSRHPIILDQPEDDLDNRFVYEGLAKYLKGKKIDRQIIVVTHNPNVVVGADSEHVIVANQSGEESNKDNRRCRFEYVYGGLENSFEEEGNSYVLERQGIREHVCEILDGGEDAFRRRERLYTGFRKLVRKSLSDNIVEDAA